MILTAESTLNKLRTLSDDWVRWIHCFHCFYSLLTLLITLILLTLLILLEEGLRVTKILKYCWIDHIYYIFPIVVVSWSILDVGRGDHFGQCFRLDWRLESPHQTGGRPWVTSKMAGQVFRLRRILTTTLIQFHPNWLPCPGFERTSKYFRWLPSKISKMYYLYAGDIWWIQIWP